MNEYHRVYWSLYLDFLQAFRPLKYAGIPLPLLSTFHLYLDDELKKAMKEPGFWRVLNHRIENESDFQPIFENYLWRQGGDGTDSSGTCAKGKLVMYTSLLFFPISVFESFFSPSDTLMVVPKPLKTPRFTGGIPYYPMSPYSMIPEKAARKVLKQLDELLRSYKRHPVFGRASFIRIFRHDVTRFLGQIQSISRLFAKNPISCVLLGTTNDSVSRLIALMAGRKGIPSVCMQHGLLGNEEGFLPVFTSNIAVYGELDAQWFIRKGIGAERIEKIGHPRFDRIFTELRRSRREMLSQIDLAPEERVVLVATNPIRDMEAWSAYIEQVIRIPNTTVLIKPHRNEIRRKMLEPYEALAKRFPKVKLLPNANDHLYDWIRSADVVAVELSTIGLEAMLCQVPTVFLRKRDYSDINHEYYYQEMGEFVDTDPIRLAKQTERLMLRPKQRLANLMLMKQFISRAYSVTLSAQALHDLIARLTSTSYRTNSGFSYEGKLIRGPDQRIYLVEQGFKRHFTSMEPIRKRGWQKNPIVPVSESVLAQIPSGPIIG